MKNTSFKKNICVVTHTHKISNGGRETKITIITSSFQVCPWKSVEYEMDTSQMAFVAVKKGYGASVGLWKSNSSPRIWGWIAKSDLCRPGITYPELFRVPWKPTKHRSAARTFGFLKVIFKEKRQFSSSARFVSVFSHSSCQLCNLVTCIFIIVIQ